MTEQEILQELIENSTRIDSLLGQQEMNLNLSNQEFEIWKQDLRSLISRQNELLQVSENHSLTIRNLQNSYNQQEMRLKTLETDQSASQNDLSILQNQQNVLVTDSTKHSETIRNLQNSQDETKSSFESYKEENLKIQKDLEAEVQQLKIRNNLQSIGTVGIVVLAVIVIATK